MKKVASAFIVVLALGAAGYYFRAHPQKPRQAACRAGPAEATATVAPRNISFIFTAAGDLGPADQVSVRPEINGRISELPVDIGSTVKKGDLLFALDDTDLQTDRSSRLTDIEGTQLALDRARRTYERNKELFGGKLISQEAFEDCKTDLDLAQNTLEKARKALQTVEVQLSKARIMAPFDCTVLTRPVSAGQAVSGSAGFNAGTEVMTIANLKDMLVAAHVNQADITRMKIGQVVDIEAEAVPGLKFQGTVERIAPQATIKNNIKCFADQNLLKDIDPRERPGMTANMSIPLASAENVLAIPLAAVFTDQSGRYAYVKTEGGFESRPVQIGIVDFQYAEVVSGLAAGDVVSLVRPAPGEESDSKPAKSTAPPKPAARGRRGHQRRRRKAGLRSFPAGRPFDCGGLWRSLNFATSAGFTTWAARRSGRWTISPSTSKAGNSSPSAVRPAAASPRCCMCWVAWIHPAGAR